MTRNTIGVPPLEPRDTPEPRGRRTVMKKGHVTHPDMDPAVTAGARVGEVPDVASHDVTERDTPVNLYIAIAIGVVALILAVMVFSAVF